MIDVFQLNSYFQVANVSKVVTCASTYSHGIVVRGGGHGYTCQAAASDAILIDMRNFRSIEFIQHNTGLNMLNSQSTYSLKVGTGLTWQEVLDYIQKQLNNKYLLVHGQCTSVGVGGFSLHGGVHFGGLSELYGLASENIEQLTAVISNGSIVILSQNSCIIDDIEITPYSNHCNDLWFAFRGAGSSYGIVTSITFRLNETPILQSALSIVSIKATNVELAQQSLSKYLVNVPEHVSLTLFGLDAYFKAYFFLLKFASNKWEAIRYKLNRWKNNHVTNHSNVRDESNSGFESYIYFIVEASWITSTQMNINNTGKEGMEGKEDNTILELNKLYDNYLTTNFESGTFVQGKWLRSPSMWSVPSYDLVWGKGHAYGGASIIVDKLYEETVLKATLQIFNTYSKREKSGGCSDCVTVLHRIGKGLRHGGTLSPSYQKSTHTNESLLSIPSSTYTHTNSFNPFKNNASLWVEIDCGHFYRQKNTWPICRNSIDVAQRTLDLATTVDHRSHYPNVPNLATQDWPQQYYGKEGFQRLVTTKKYWDPINMFQHAQSIPLSYSLTPSSLNDVQDSMNEMVISDTSHAQGIHSSNQRVYKKQLLQSPDSTLFIDPPPLNRKASTNLLNNISTCSRRYSSVINRYYIRSFALLSLPMITISAILSKSIRNWLGSIVGLVYNLFQKRFK